MEAYHIWLNKEKSPGFLAVTRSFVMIRRHFLSSILMKMDLITSRFFFHYYMPIWILASLSYPTKHIRAHVSFEHIIQLNQLIINNCAMQVITFVKDLYTANDQF